MPNIYKNRETGIDTDATNNLGAESDVSGASMSSISVRRLVTVINDAKRCSFIDRVMNLHKMSYSSVLVTFKIYHEASVSVKDEV